MEKRKREIIEIIITKAWEDSCFKKNLITEPIKTIENLTGIKVALPEGKTLIVNDQTDKSIIFINIPAAPEPEKNTAK